MNAGQSVDAVAAYQRALDIGPESGNLRAELGHALFQIGRWDEAATQARRARELGVVDALLLQRLTRWASTSTRDNGARDQRT